MFRLGNRIHIYVYSGKARNLLYEGNLQEIVLEKNDLMFISPNVDHRMIVDNDSIVINIMVRYNWMIHHIIPALSQEHPFTKLLSQLAMDQSEKKTVLFHLPNLAILRSTLLETILDYCNMQKYRNEFTSLNFSRFMMMVMMYGEMEAVETPVYGNLKESIPAVVTYINRQYTSSCHEIAAHFGVTDSYLNVAFQEKMGMPVHKYLVGTRLRRAAELLTTSTLNIADISVSVGYSDTASFNRAFKLHFRQTQSQYRKEHAEKNYL